MIHHTYRRLDEPSLQLGPLSFPQWLAIAAIGALCFGLKTLTGMTTQPFLCIATVAMGGPFAAMALSEGDRPSHTRLVRDAVRWAFGPKLFGAGGGAPTPYTLKLKPPRASRRELEVLDTAEEVAP
jgi:hypothetical protein